MNELEKCAEILVESGYEGAEWVTKLEHIVWICKDDRDLDGLKVEVQVFCDTLEGRRQADAIEDWLLKEENELWHISGGEICSGDDYKPNSHQWRLDRIKWCIQQLRSDKTIHQQENEAKK